MKSLFVILSAAVIGGVLSYTLVGSAQGSKTPSAVAFVNASRISTETAQGRTEMAKLQTMQQQRTTEIRAKQQAIEQNRVQMAAAKDEPGRVALMQKEGQLRAELERLAQQTQIDYANLQRDINVDLQRRVRTILDDLARTNSYQMVVNGESAVLWANPELDLTSAVIQRMNAQP